MKRMDRKTLRAYAVIGARERLAQIGKEMDAIRRFIGSPAPVAPPRTPSKPANGGWTPERRAAHSKAMRRRWRKWRKEESR